MLRRTIRSAGADAAVAGLVLACAALVLQPAATLAQTGGGTGGGATSGTTGGAGSPGGAAGQGTIGDTTAPSTTPGPSPKTPATGPQSRSPAMPPSPIPPRDTGIPPVPSAGNAEPNSPIYRRDTQPGTLTPDRAPSTTQQPQVDTPPGGSGGGGALGQEQEQGGGGSVSGDPLIPTDPAGNPAESESGRPTTSIGEEPDRIKRGAGAAGGNLDECMKLWDPSTHMTKERWRETCERLGR